ncbi:MAG: HEAT repeat domain-containing protein [Planctomycetes bacterium]|nr:HEAT repeat domain-containing protein [Planctomycetota bacterium]
MGTRIVAVRLALIAACVACGTAAGVAAADDKPPAPAAPPRTPPKITDPKLLPDPVLSAEAQKKHDEEVKALVKQLRSEKNKEMVELQIGNLGKQGTRATRDALIEYCQGNKNQEYLDHAFKALAVIGGTTVLEYLTGKEALRCDDFMTNVSAATALGESKDARAIPHLIEILDGKSPKIEVQGACLIALGKCGGTKSKEAADAILARCTAKQDTVRANALEAYGYTGAKDAVPFLAEHLATEKNTRCRGAAATGLGWTKSKDAIPFLQTAANGDDSQTVRECAMNALKALSALR